MIKFWKHIDGKKGYSYDDFEEQKTSILPTLLLVIGFIALGAIVFLNM